MNHKNVLNNVLKDIKFIATKDVFVENQFLVSLPELNYLQIFKLVNKLQKNPSIEFVEPNFIRLIKPNTSDPYYDFQWSINNQGYLGGTIDADMDVDKAWQVSTGKGVTVAIIDEGVDLTHDDLTSNLLPGFDATGNNSQGAPNESNNDAHGTACAGIVVAVANNNNGIAGIAYNARVLPVRIAYSNGYPLGDYRRSWITDNNWIASGINWAVQNGADVLSNSWGGGSPSSTITDAINNAVNNGRNGNGCVVLFATGNNNGAINYPAKLENVIAVGASSMCDERKSPLSCDGENWWGSNYGQAIDVVGPGVEIYTTDISGKFGYSNGDYESSFNGTSSACPNTAGVVALILSANPHLTQENVRELLEISTEKPLGYIYSNHVHGTWNEEVGYGRVNAYNALLNTVLVITGPNIVCTSNSTFILHNLPPSESVVWMYSTNLTQVGSNNESTFVVKAKSSSTSSAGWVQATVNGLIFTHYVWVGKPNFTLEGDSIVGVFEPGVASLDYNQYQGITNVNWTRSDAIATVRGAYCRTFSCRLTTGIWFCVRKCNELLRLKRRNVTC